MTEASEQARTLSRGVVGSTRLITFGVSNVAPAAAVVAGLVIVVSYAGYASPLVVIVAFVASLCCANSIAQFARRLPSAGSLYTYNSRGLGQVGGFLTGWMMIFAYLVYVPAVIALTSQYASQLLADELHVRIKQSVLFTVILAAVVLLAYLGIRTSATVDLVLVGGEMAIIAALAITILVEVGPAHYSASVFSPGATPHGQFSPIANAMIYGITAFAGFEAAASLGEEARNPRRAIPASTIGIVVVTGVFYLLVVLAETFGLGRQGILVFAQQPNPLGYLTVHYWSTSVLWLIELVVVLTGLGFAITAFNVAIRLLFAMGRERVLPHPLAHVSRRHTPAVAIGCVAALALIVGLPLTHAYGGVRAFAYLAGAGGLSVVLIYLAVNIAVIRAMRTAFRDEFRVGPHVLLPVAAVVLFLFPLWGILHPRTHNLVARLPFTALAWLGVGLVLAAILRTRRPASFATLGRVFED
jgi:amino acid transporter